MQSHQFLDACQNLRAFHPFLSFCHRSPSPSSNSLFFLSKGSISKDSKVSCSSNLGKRKPRNGKKQRGKSSGGERVRFKEKENVRSIDNELAKTTKKSSRRRRGRQVKNVGRSKNSRVIISAAMLMEVETVLQT